MITPGLANPRPLFPAQQAWIGALIPKRWAKRAVTRNAIKRQSYTVSQHFEEQLPAAMALIRRGEPALDAVIETYYREALTVDDRLAMAFVAARIGGPKAVRFLEFVRYTAAAELRFADEGMKNKAPAK